MIRPRMNHCEPVIPRTYSSGDSGRQNTVHRGRVQTLEEHEVFWIRRSRLTEAGQLFNNHMRMPHDVPIAVGL